MNHAKQDKEFPFEMNIKSWLNHLRKDNVNYKSLTLPAFHLRTGGAQFHDNAYFVQSANQEVVRLKTHFNLSNNPVLLDIGCGFGRLAIGFINNIDTISYIGIDVNNIAISWCRKYIANYCSDFRFIHLNLHNKRYNPNGNPINASFKLPLDDETVHIVYLYSVFSHMLQNDVKLYLHELNRILVPGGGIFFTAFSEPNVPIETVNPPDYQNIEWKAELHCVRYNHKFLLSLLEKNGFILDSFEYGNETEGQSAFYITKQID